MKRKKVLFSFEKRNGVLEKLFPLLKAELTDIEIVYHDPKSDVLILENINKQYEDFDLFIIKVASETSLDLLYFANLHNIKTLHDLKPVLTCKNKVALDHVLRKSLQQSNPDDMFHLPKSWCCSLSNKQKFKEWVKPKLPVVLKSHYQHNEYVRFNYLVRNMQEIDDFYETYKNLLYYDVYIQKFIECDGIDRKIYVMDEKVFGIRRKNPIYIFLEEHVETLDVETLERAQFNPQPQIQKLALSLAKDLGLKLFGFDLIKPIDQEGYYLIDLNDFPGFRGIKQNCDYLLDFFESFIQKSLNSES